MVAQSPARQLLFSFLRTQPCGFVTSSLSCPKQRGLFSPIERVTRCFDSTPSAFSNFERHCSLLAKSRLYSGFRGHRSVLNATGLETRLMHSAAACSCWVSSGVRLASLKSKRSVHQDAVGCFIEKSGTLINLRLYSCVDANRIEQAPGRSLRRWYRGPVGSSRSMQGHWVLANIRLADETVSAVSVFTADFSGLFWGSFAASLKTGIAVTRLRNTLSVLDAFGKHR